MSLDIRARVRTFDKISRVIQSSPPRNTWPIRPFSPKLWIHGVSQKQKNELPQWLSTKCGSSYNVHRSHRRSLGHNFPICPAAIAGAFFVNFARLFVLVSPSFCWITTHHATWQSHNSQHFAKRMAKQRRSSTQKTNKCSISICVKEKKNYCLMWRTSASGHYYWCAMEIRQHTYRIWWIRYSKASFSATSDRRPKTKKTVMMISENAYIIRVVSYAHIYALHKHEIIIQLDELSIWRRRRWLQSIPEGRPRRDFCCASFHATRHSSRAQCTRRRVHLLRPSTRKPLFSP